MRALAAAALAIALAGCAQGPPPSSPMPDGRLTIPPAGWVAFCADHPDQPRCAR